MRWRGRQGSDNVEDRRGLPGGRMVLGGGIGGIVLIVVILLLGGDPTQLLDQGTQMMTPEGGPAVSSPEQEELEQFVSVVLKDTEDVWHTLLSERGQEYVEPRLVLFTGMVSSACGQAGSAMGPFYCPGDRQVYIDLEFFEELNRRFGAPGDFAQAYVIAHEIGHHVQNLLGISDRVHAQRGRVSKEEYNQLSVRLELQADFLAGVWAHHAQATQQVLEPGDLEEALRAASAIGDDRLQRQAGDVVTPDSFTHGTSAQRMRWFRRGFESGDLSQGDTFNAVL